MRFPRVNTQNFGFGRLMFDFSSILSLIHSNCSTKPRKHHKCSLRCLCHFCSMHIHPTCFLCGWSVGVELLARLFARSCCWLRHIQTFENVYFCFEVHSARFEVYSALEVFRFSARLTMLEPAIANGNPSVRHSWVQYIEALLTRHDRAIFLVA